MDGGGLRQVTSSRLDASEPAWSPTGGQIAFTLTDRDDDSRVYVMNADGSARRRVTSRGDASEPAWSPDGSRLAYTSIRGGAAALYHVAAAGGPAVRLTPRPGPDLQAAWQPAIAAALPIGAPAAPPSLATVDARVVGTFVEALLGVLPAITAVERRHSADLLAGARRMDRHARRVRAAVRPLAPSNLAVQDVREVMRNLRAVASRTRRLAGLVRRHERRAASTAREGLSLGIVLGTLLPLVKVGAEVGVLAGS